MFRRGRRDTAFQVARRPPDQDIMRRYRMTVHLAASDFPTRGTAFPSLPHTATLALLFLNSFVDFYEMLRMGRTPVTEIHYLDFLAATEEIFRDVIRRCYPTSWDENHITYTIADELAAKLPSVRVTGFDRPFNVKWDARKLRGKPEQAFGDLAVVVRVTAWSGEQIDGVGLLEAKRRYEDKGTFSALGKQQLRKIVRNAPSSRLLLYDYSQIADFEDNLHAPHVWSSREQLRWPYHPYNVTPYSHSVTVPTSLALATGLNSTALYKYSIPFSVQLCSRYLRGFDLEFRNDTISKIEDFINNTGGPRTLLLVGVSTGEAEPALPDWVSRDLYGPIRG